MLEGIGNVSLQGTQLEEAMYSGGQAPMGIWLEGVGVRGKVWLLPTPPPTFLSHWGALCAIVIPIGSIS